MKPVVSLTLLLHFLCLPNTLNGLVLPPRPAYDPNEGLSNEPTPQGEGQVYKYDVQQYPDVIHKQNEFKPTYLSPPKSNMADTSRDLYEIIRTRRASDTRMKLSPFDSSFIKPAAKKFHSANYFPYYPYPPTPLRQRGVEEENHAQPRATNNAKILNQDEDHHNILQERGGLQQALLYLGQGHPHGNKEAAFTVENNEQSLMTYTKSPQMFSYLHSSNKQNQQNTGTRNFHGRKRRDVKVTEGSRDKEEQLARSRDSALKRLMSSFDLNDYTKADGSIHGYIEDVRPRPVQATGLFTPNNIASIRRRLRRVHNSLSEDNPNSVNYKTITNNRPTANHGSESDSRPTLSYKTITEDLPTIYYGSNIDVRPTANTRRSIVGDRPTSNSRNTERDRLIKNDIVTGYIEDISTPKRSWFFPLPSSTSSIGFHRRTTRNPDLPLNSKGSIYGSSRDALRYLNPLNGHGTNFDFSRDIRTSSSINPLYADGGFVDSGRDTSASNHFNPWYAQRTYRDTNVVNSVYDVPAYVDSNRNSHIPVAVESNPLYAMSYSSLKLPAHPAELTESISLLRLTPVMLSNVPTLSSDVDSLFPNNVNPSSPTSTVNSVSHSTDSIHDVASLDKSGNNVDLSPFPDSVNVRSVLSRQGATLDKTQDSSNTLPGLADGLNLPDFGRTNKPTTSQLPFTFQLPTRVTHADISRPKSSRHGNIPKKFRMMVGKEEPWNILNIGGREFVKPWGWETPLVAEPSLTPYPILAHTYDSIDGESENRNPISGGIPGMVTKEDLPDTPNPSIVPEESLYDTSDPVISGALFHRIKRHTAPTVLRSSHHGNSHHGHHGPAHHGGQGNQGNGVNVNGNQGDIPNGNQENTQIGPQIPEVDGLLSNQGNNANAAQIYGSVVNQGGAADMIPANPGNNPPDNSPVTVQNNQVNAMDDTPDVGPNGQRITGGLDDFTDTLPANLDTPALPGNQDFQTNIGAGTATGAAGFQDYQTDLQMNAGATGLQGYPDYQTDLAMTGIQGNSNYQTDLAVNTGTGWQGYQDYQTDLAVTGIQGNAEYQTNLAMTGIQGNTAYQADTAITGIQGTPDYQVSPTMTGIQGNQDYQTDVNQGTGFLGIFDYPLEAGQVIPGTGLVMNQRQDVEDENNIINTRVNIGAANQDILNLQGGPLQAQDDR